MLTFGLSSAIHFECSAYFCTVIFHDLIFLRWTLIGVTSAGFGCAVDKQPGIYHKVSIFLMIVSHIFAINCDA